MARFTPVEKPFSRRTTCRKYFVEYGMQSGFEKYRSQLENYIFPALVGFLNTDDLKKIKTVEFVKMPEGTVTYKIEQTYEQFNKEPVFG